jgi:hypothetical protein
LADNGYGIDNGHTHQPDNGTFPSYNYNYGNGYKPSNLSTSQQVNTTWTEKYSNSNETGTNDFYSDLGSPVTSLQQPTNSFLPIDSNVRQPLYESWAPPTQIYNQTVYNETANINQSHMAMSNDKESMMMIHQDDDDLVALLIGDTHHSRSSSASLPSSVDVSESAVQSQDEIFEEIQRECADIERRSLSASPSDSPTFPDKLSGRGKKVFHSFNYPASFKSSALEYISGKQEIGRR